MKVPNVRVRVPSQMLGVKDLERCPVLEMWFICPGLQIQQGLFGMASEATRLNTFQYIASLNLIYGSQICAILRP